MCVLLRRGPKWSYVLELSTLKQYRLPSASERTWKPETSDLNRNRVAARMIKRQKFLKRCGIATSTSAVKEAYRLLRNS